LRSTIWSTKKGPWGEIDFLCLWHFITVGEIYQLYPKYQDTIWWIP
jgi:hypothetical protein